MKILIASVHFGIGHVAHLKAYINLTKSCGYTVRAYLNEDYKKYIEQYDDFILESESDLKNYKPDIVLLYNTGFENLHFMKICKNMNSRVLFVLHEPYMGMKELLKEGSYCIKQLVASVLNTYICSKADVVILSSKYASENCKKYMKNAYKKSVLFPLIFQDGFIKSGERRYFSFIGGFGHAHGADIYLDFVKKSCEDNNILFQIATRTNIEKELENPCIDKMIKQGRLIVKQGRPLTSDEIDAAYRNSICTWNCYRRSTQSGVLPNSFMQGTPVIASNTGSFKDYVISEKTGVLINESSYDEIYSGYKKIYQNLEKYENNCRELFKNQFYYDMQVDKFKQIVSSIKGIGE